MELKVTKEKILEAAKKCGIAKETLKVLFPEVFETHSILKKGNPGYNESVLAVFGNFEGLANAWAIALDSDNNEGNRFILRTNVEWVIEKENNNIYLVPKCKNNG